MIGSLLLFFIHDALFFLSYVSNRSTFPKPLSRQEESALLEKAVAGDEQARTRLIEHNLRLVAHIAHKYVISGYDQDDLVSIGTIGLIKGVNTFRPDTGTQLSTYCARCIENEILMVMRSSQKRKGDISLQDPIGTDGEGNEVSLMDILSASDRPVCDCVEMKIAFENIQRHIVRVLSPRERMVIELRYGLYDGKMYAQQEIAEQLGISRSYVSRIEKKALELLRDAFEGRLQHD